MGRKDPPSFGRRKKMPNSANYTIANLHYSLSSFKRATPHSDLIIVGPKAYHPSFNDDQLMKL